MDGVGRIDFLPMADYQKINRKSTDLIQDMDADGDGVLSIGELGATEELFAKIDKNEDGQVDKEELNGFFAKARLNHTITSVLEDRDTNADGLLDINELGVSYERFMRIDTNGNGQVGRGELSALLPKAYLNQKAAALMQSFDTNNDTFLHPNELPISDDRFAMIDTNEDGLIGGRELASSLRPMHFMA